MADPKKPTTTTTIKAKKPPTLSGTTPSTVPTQTPRPNGVSSLYGGYGGAAQATKNLSQAQMNSLRLALALGVRPDTIDPTLTDVLMARVNVGTDSDQFGSWTTTRTVRGAMEGLFSMDEPDLIALQSRLAAAGFYGDATPVWGSAADTVDAYRTLLNLGVLEADKTLVDILDERTAAQAGAPARPGRVGGGGFNLIEVLGDETANALVDEIAVAVLGKTPTEAQRRKAREKIQGHQRSTQSSAIAAQDAASRASFDAQGRMADANAAAAQAAQQGAGAVPGHFNPETASQVKAYGEALAKSYGLTVTSVGRTRAHNAKVKGAPNSDHLVADDGETLLNGGALDLSGSKQAMEALAAWARANSGPGKLFRYVEYGTDDHLDHVHLSFNDEGGSATPGAIPVTADTTDVWMPTRTAETAGEDPKVLAENELRAADPTQAGAHDFAQAFDTFTKLIGG